MNHPDDYVQEMIAGFVNAYSRYYEKHPEVNGIILKQRRSDKVTLVIGGGSGHEPMFSGFVGTGLADAAACGNVFASPDPRTICETAKAVEQGRGVMFVYGCYAGDNLNFDMGEEFLNSAGIPTSHVRVWDDVASAPLNRIDERRGIAGDVFVIKIAGAACDAGLELPEVVRITEKARDRTRSVGVATAPAQLPGVEEPIFQLGEDEIEYGMGLHGERGVLRTSWQPADVLTKKMYNQIKADCSLESGMEVCVLINGLGSTTIGELAVVYHRLKQLLSCDNIAVYDADLNNYCTSQEMGGFSITLFLLDEELKKYYDMPCWSPYYSKGELTGLRHDNQEKTNDGMRSGADFNTTTKETAAEYAVPVKLPQTRLSSLSAGQARDMLMYIADKIIGKKELLTKIDSAVGDGDHGIGMALGMENVKKSLSKLTDENDVYRIFETAGKAMLLSMGGASGVIFGSLYLAGAKDMTGTAELSAEDLAKMERKSLTAIQERGKASVGDKTMVDALAPAVEALESHIGDGLYGMLKAAEQAAFDGLEATRGFNARFGRAKSLGERAIGHRDAGAASVWLIFQGMREFVAGKEV